MTGLVVVLLSCVATTPHSTCFSEWVEMPADFPPSQPPARLLPLPFSGRRHYPPVGIMATLPCLIVRQDWYGSRGQQVRARWKLTPYRNVLSRASVVLLFHPPSPELIPSSKCLTTRSCQRTGGDWRILSGLSVHAPFLFSDPN